MTFTLWFVTNALRVSTSVTSPLLAAGLTGAGRDPGSSAQSVSVQEKKKKDSHFFPHSVLII